MSAPSRRSSGRRRRALRVFAESLAEELGPDESEVIYEFDDGWTVRRVRRWQDQLREGWLLHHCLRKATAAQHDPNCWSLRDPDNLPHITFTAWAKPPFDAWAARFAMNATLEMMEDTSRSTSVKGDDVVILAAIHRLTDAHRMRLEEFAQNVAPEALPRLPGVPGKTAATIQVLLAAELPVNLRRPEDASLKARYDAWRGDNPGEVKVQIEPVEDARLAGVVAGFLNEELGAGLFGRQAVLDADVSLVAWCSGEIAGAALAKIKTAPDMRDWFERYPDIVAALPAEGLFGDLEALAVRPEFRRHGIGTRLLAERVEQLDAMWVDHLIACAWRSAEHGCHAGSLLEAAGFHPIATAHHFYAGWVVCPLCGPACTCDCVVYLRSLED
jgi:ribosomal protein S18 acetylase RimI-like enzyme